MLNNFAGWNYDPVNQILGVAIIFGIPIIFIMLLIFSLSGRRRNSKKDSQKVNYERKKDPMFWFMAIPAGLILLSVIFIFINSFL